MSKAMFIFTLNDQIKTKIRIDLFEIATYRDYVVENGVVVQIGLKNGVFYKVIERLSYIDKLFSERNLLYVLK